MTPRPPGKAAQEMQRLREENAALRDLLAAVQETAATAERAPGADPDPWKRGWHGSMRIAGWLSDVSDLSAAQLARTAALFRKNAADLAAPDAASIASGQPAAATGDEPEGLEDAAAQDEDEDDGGCVAPSPAGSACLRPAGHDLIGGTPHRDVNRRHWDDDGWLTAEGEDEPKCARPGCGHPRHHHWEFGPVKPGDPASGCDLTSCLCAAYAAAVVTAGEIRDLRQPLQDPAPVVRVLSAPEAEDAR
jgi:hypothetical protein